MDFNRLQEVFDTHTFTVFDTETSGLEPALERVIEIGALRFDKKGIICRYSVLINPQRPITADITRITGIQNDMIKDKPKIGDVIDTFLSFISDSILIAHNAPFDMSFINAELTRLSRPTLTHETIDTIPLAKKAFPQAGKYGLQALASYLHITVKNAHRAEDDARVCMEIFLKSLKTLHYTE